MRYLVFILLFVSVVNAQDKVALLIGNYDYEKIGKLQNSSTDIDALAKTLESIGFHVIKKYNLNAKNMRETLYSFQKELNKYDKPISFVYYGGHGVQVDGNNYLIPTDVNTRTRNDIHYNTIGVNYILSLLDSANTKANLLFLDTCRDVPNGYRSSTHGLGQPKMVVSRTLIVFSTEAGNVSLDNNLFIKELIKSLQVPYSTIGKIAYDISNSVAKKTYNRQIPMVSMKLISNDLVLNELKEENNIVKKVLTNRLSNWYKKQYALVIGISKYKNDSIDYLPNAVNDANSISKLLKKQGVNVSILKNEEATKSNILKTIKSIKNKLSKDDSVLVYFSGHGKGISLVSHKRVGYIIPYDFDSSLKSNDLMDYDAAAISLDALKKYMYNYSAKHILLMLDSCFSGLTFESRALEQPKKGDIKYYDRLLNTKAINILTSGADEEVSDGVENHSPFTYYLLKALGDGNVDIEDGDHIATFAELAMYVKLKVVKETEGQQTPQYSKNNFDGEFIFKIP